MFALLRRLRHGPLSFLGPVWLFLGRRYRSLVRKVPGLSVTQKIGPYGPFKILAEFTFTDLDHWGGAHNKGFLKCIEACRKEVCVFDIGAHVGFVTLPAASVMPSDGKIFAFEPSAANSAMLQKHIQLNGFEEKVEVVNSLVGIEVNDAVPFFESVGPHGQNSIILKSETTLNSEHGGYSRTTRPQISLDNFCASRELNPKIIKIDVEGAEIGVLQGARETLERCKPLLVLSVHPREIALADGSLTELTDLIGELGYEILDVEDVPVTELKLDEYLVVPQGNRVQ